MELQEQSRPRPGFNRLKRFIVGRTRQETLLAYFKGIAESDNALDSALRRELICVKPSKRRPIRKLVDSVAYDGIIYAARLKDQLDNELIPLSADVALTGESQNVGYLAKIKSQSQRADAVRFAAAILWPTEVENSLRDALWQVKSKSSRYWLAVSVREANGGGA